MLQIRDGNINIMYSENIPYLRVDLEGYLTPDQFKVNLQSAKLFDLIREKAVTQVLINANPLERFGTEDLEWMTAEWFSIAAAAGVKRVSLVVSSMVYNFFVNLFNVSLARLDRNVIDVRVFYENQFYETAESVEWFEGI